MSAPIAIPNTSSRPDAGARVMLVQMGARRNYIYAQQLAAAGLLHSLVTDAAWPEPGLRGWKQKVSRVFHVESQIARRTVRNVPADRVFSSLLPNLATLAGAWMHSERRFAFVDEALALDCRLRGPRGADIIVNYQGNGGSFLDYAKKRGARIVTDFIITPKCLNIEEAERRLWPDWEMESTPQPVLDLFRRRMDWLVRLSDLYLCPSETVARDLADFPGFDPTRVRLLPYGSSGVLLSEPRPVPGRVLFVGTAGLRKGLPYLAEAARILRRRRPDIAIAVAGHAPALVRARPETRDLTFLGVLDSTRMAEAYANSDIFCLPSLAEGSATSVFEAMAHGLPAVTSSSSGSVVTDGVDGIIAPERDGAAVADAIERIVSDRDLRQRMSEAARTTVARYSDAACGRRFIDIIRQVA
jgi:glycosyltransferase involved in cell wall biosynthesis